MAVRRASTLSLDNSRGKVQQQLRKFRQKVKKIPWLPEHLQRPELLAPRRFPNANLSSSHVDNTSEHDQPLLFKLPAEIRLKIYEYVIAEPDDDHLDHLSFESTSVFHSITALPINCIWRVPGRLIAKPPLPNLFVSIFTLFLAAVSVLPRLHADKILIDVWSQSPESPPHMQDDVCGHHRHILRITHLLHLQHCRPTGLHLLAATPASSQYLPFACSVSSPLAFDHILVAESNRKARKCICQSNLRRRMSSKKTNSGADLRLDLGEDVDCYLESDERPAHVAGIHSPV